MIIKTDPSTENLKEKRKAPNPHKEIEITFYPVPGVAMDFVQVKAPEGARFRHFRFSYILQGDLIDWEWRTENAYDNAAQALAHALTEEEIECCFSGSDVDAMMFIPREHRSLLQQHFQELQHAYGDTLIDWDEIDPAFMGATKDVMGSIEEENLQVDGLINSAHARRIQLVQELQAHSESPLDDLVSAYQEEQIDIEDILAIMPMFLSGAMGPIDPRVFDLLEQLETPQTFDLIFSYFTFLEDEELYVAALKCLLQTSSTWPFLVGLQYRKHFDSASADERVDILTDLLQRDAEQQEAIDEE